MKQLNKPMEHDFNMKPTTTKMTTSFRHQQFNMGMHTYEIQIIHKHTCSYALTQSLKTNAIEEIEMYVMQQDIYKSIFSIHKYANFNFNILGVCDSKYGSTMNWSEAVGHQVAV